MHILCHNSPFQQLLLALASFFTHFRLPWHSYNVKRKVHGLEPVTEAVFEDRQRLSIFLSSDLYIVVEASQNTKKENQKCYCDVCRYLTRLFPIL